MFAAFIWYAFIVACGEERIQNDRGGIWRDNVTGKEKKQFIMIRRRSAGALQGDRHSVTFSSRMMTECLSRGHAPAVV